MANPKDIEWAQDLIANCEEASLYDKIVAKLDEVRKEYEPKDQGCTVPPAGWWCSREKGHEGPCAARPNKTAVERFRERNGE